MRFLHCFILIASVTGIRIIGNVRRYAGDKIPIDLVDKDDCECHAQPVFVATAPSDSESFKVTFRQPDGGEIDVQCGPDTYLLDAAEEAGIDLPYACRAGACSACAAKVVSGDISSVDTHEQSYLSADQLKKGYILTCVGYARGDCIIETNKESEVH